MSLQALLYVLIAGLFIRINAINCINFFAVCGAESLVAAVKKLFFSINIAGFRFQVGYTTTLLYKYIL